MGFDMVQIRTRFKTNSLHCPNLPGQLAPEFPEGQPPVSLTRPGFKDIRPAEAGPVGIRRMCAYSNSMLQRFFNAAPDGNGVARVAATRNVSRTDQGKNGLIGGHALAHIAVEVDLQHSTTSFKRSRQERWRMCSSLLRPISNCSASSISVHLNCRVSEGRSCASLGRWAL